MLDEILEEEQYSWDFNRPDRAVYRLKYRTLNKDLSGISRAMVLVARKALFQDVQDYALLTGEQQCVRVFFARECLKAWCGDYSDDNPDCAQKTAPLNAPPAPGGCPENPYVDGEAVPESIKDWFPKYLVYMREMKEKGNIQKIEEKFNARRKTFRGTFQWGHREAKMTTMRSHMKESLPQPFGRGRSSGIILLLKNRCLTDWTKKAGEALLLRKEFADWTLAAAGLT